MKETASPYLQFETYKQMDNWATLLREGKLKNDFGMKTKRLV